MATKTDFVEIFQTIRASMQPYTAQGFTNRINSEAVYDLWSEKNVQEGGERITERCFASLEIETKQVLLKIADEKTKEVSELDDALLLEIETDLATSYSSFKERDWI